MKNLNFHAICIILFCSFITFSCKKDVSNVPIPGGKASIGIVMDEYIPAGAKIKLDATFTSVSAMKKFSIDQTVTKKDGTVMPNVSILKDSALDGSLKYEFNYYYDIPEDLADGDIMRINYHVTNSDATTDFGKNTVIKDPTYGYIFNPTTLTIKAGTTGKFTVSANCSVNYDELILKDQATQTVIFDTLLLPRQKNVTKDIMLKIPSGTTGTKIIELTMKEKKYSRNFTGTYSIGIN